MELARKKIMESMGFSFEGDYEEIIENMSKRLKQKYPVFESKIAYNQPDSPEYGKNVTAKGGFITLKEAFDLYDQNLSTITDIHNLNKDYLKDEETAFKNAILFHSNRYYRISY
jgi:hypothetical protein